MKRIITIFLTFLLMTCSVISSVSASSADIADTGKTVLTIGDWVYEKIENDRYYEIDEYIGESTEVFVPRIVGDTLVVKLGDHSFMNNTTITSVVTSSPLWTVGEYAFIDCTALKRFECNYALETIESGAFSGTSALMDINLQDSIVTEIKPYTFLNSGIKEIVLPETCTTIGNYAFGQCQNLRKIVIPDSVTSIHEDAFKGTNTVIVCNPDSYAAAFAAEKGLTVISPEDDILFGDANGDGSVNINDVTAIQKYKLGMAELTEYGMLCADVNGDGDVTIRDATLIQMKIAGISVGF